MEIKEDLDGWRKKIDELDNKLLELIRQRLNVCKEIGEFKKNNGFAIKDKDREKEILKNSIENSDLDPKFISKLFKLILKESRRNQNDCY